MNRTMKAVLAGALLMPVLSYAADDGFSHSYVEGSYVNSDLLETDGFQATASYGFTPMFFGYASYTDLSSDAFDDFGGDSETIEAGLGFNHGLSSNLELVGTLSYIDTDADFDDGEGGVISEDASGFGVGLGLRGRLAPNLELEGGLKYVNLEDADSDTSVNLAARYFFTPAVAAGVGVNMNDSVETYMVSVRWNFR